MKSLISSKRVVDCTMKIPAVANGSGIALATVAQATASFGNTCVEAAP